MGSSSEPVTTSQALQALETPSLPQGTGWRARRPHACRLQPCGHPCPSSTNGPLLDSQARPPPTSPWQLGLVGGSSRWPTVFGPSQQSGWRPGSGSASRGDPPPRILSPATPPLCGESGHPSCGPWERPDSDATMCDLSSGSGTRMGPCSLQAGRVPAPGTPYILIPGGPPGPPPWAWAPHTCVEGWAADQWHPSPSPSPLPQGLALWAICAPPQDWDWGQSQSSLWGWHCVLKGQRGAWLYKLLS